MTSIPPKIPHIKGVRANPGGVVLFQELRDGWATVPDLGGRIRRWQRWGIAVVILSAIGLYVDDKLYGENAVDEYLAAVFFGVLFILAVTGLISDERIGLARLRLTRESESRVGGREMLRGAIAHAGRAETVAKMNVLLSSLGRTDPVYSFTRIRQARVRNGKIWAAVRLTLDNDTTLTYRVLGWRAPGRLARAFGPEHVRTPIG